MAPRSKLPSCRRFAKTPHKIIALRSALVDPPSDECELWAHRRRAAITRYARSQIHQNAVSDEIHVHAGGQGVWVAQMASVLGLD